MKRSAMIEIMVLLLVISLGLSGCIGFQSFPLAARPGDTISLALGGTRYHETFPGSQIMLNDLNITIQQDKNGNGVIESSETFTVTKRYLFRLYPDPTSRAANFTTSYGMGTAPVGQWSVVVDLADPITHAPLPLDGNLQASVVVQTDKLANNYWGTSYEGSLNSIPITILPGVGQSHKFNLRNIPESDLALLQPAPQLALSFSGSGNVAAVDLVIDYDENVLKNESYIKIMQDVSMRDVTLNQRIFQDNGNKKMRILLMTNKGNVPITQLKCFVVWTLSGTVTTNTFNVTSAKFYNESGTEVTGISVVKTLLYQ